MTHLIVSNDTVRIQNQALELAKKYNPADVFYVKKNEGKKEITVDVVNKMIAQSNLASVSGKKLFIIFEAHLMNANSQNKILKTIEEANDDTTFLLLCENLTNILPTIKSRSIVSYKSNDDNLTIKKIIEETPNAELIYDYAEKFISSSYINVAITYLPVLSKPENLMLSIDALNKSIKKSNLPEKKKLSLYQALAEINQRIQANCNAVNVFDLLLIAMY